jgi:hypothetical protein
MVIFDHMGMAYFKQGEAVQAKQHLYRAPALGIEPEYARHIKDVVQ